MPDDSGIAALDVLIGLFFFYFLLSIVCSAANELIATGFNLRAGTLEQAIRSLLADEHAARRFYRHPRVRALFKPALRKLPERKPSYIPSRTFALTLLDTFAPPADGVDSHDLVKRARDALDSAKQDVPAAIPLNDTVKTLIQDALDEALRGTQSARADVDRFRTALERSFDEVMDRASGWYKRRVHLFLLVIALAVVGIANADSFALGQRLWKDKALRAAVVAEANKTVAAGSSDCVKTGQTPSQNAGACLDQVQQLGIPLGWSKATSPGGWKGWVGKVIGLLVTALALSLGAPFWFDLLGKVARLRGAGPPSPPPEPEPLPAEPAAKPSAY